MVHLSPEEGEIVKLETGNLLKPKLKAKIAFSGKIKML